MRGAKGITLQPHQILRLPRKMNLMIDRAHIWNVIYNARSDRNLPPTSPNTAPATQNESHDCSASHMKRYLQCAEQQSPPSNLTKYCACHAKWPPQIRQKFAENSWNAISNARPIREWSDHDPRMIRPWTRQSATRRATEVTYFSHSPGADSIENYNVSRSSYHSKFHLMLRLPRKVTHELHQMLRLPRKMNLMIDRHHTWNVIYIAWSNSQQPPTSPSTAPATQNERHDWSRSRMKRHLQCAEQQASPSNLTKYCASHAKWISWLIRITYETSFTMRGTTGIPLPLHQVLRLPRKMNVMIDPAHVWNVIYNALNNRYQPATSPNTAPATQNCIP